MKQSTCREANSRLARRETEVQLSRKQNESPGHLSVPGTEHLSLMRRRRHSQNCVHAQGHTSHPARGGGGGGSAPQDEMLKMMFRLQNILTGHWRALGGVTRVSARKTGDHSVSVRRSPSNNTESRRRTLEFRRT
jgi:hypothetical protein